jgi:hypothetical protein
LRCDKHTPIRDHAYEPLFCVQENRFDGSIHLRHFYHRAQALRWVEKRMGRGSLSLITITKLPGHVRLFTYNGVLEHYRKNFKGAL